MSDTTFRVIRGRSSRCKTRIPSISYYIYSLYSEQIGYGLRDRVSADLEINELLATLSVEEKGNRNIAHALDVRKALASRNYHRLFRLYNSAPNMGGYLMDFFVERERVAACCIICKSYVPLRFPLLKSYPFFYPVPPPFSYPSVGFPSVPII